MRSSNQVHVQMWYNVYWALRLDRLDTVRCARASEKRDDGWVLHLLIQPTNATTTQSWVTVPISPEALLPRSIQN